MFIKFIEMKRKNKVKAYFIWQRLPATQQATSATSKMQYIYIYIFKKEMTNCCQLKKRKRKTGYKSTKSRLQPNNPQPPQTKNF